MSYIASAEAYARRRTGLCVNEHSRWRMRL